MKKIITFIILLIVTITSVFSFGGCSNVQEPSPLFKGTHIQEVSKTNSYLLKNGSTDYKIVIPSNFNTYENLAAEEIVSFFKEGTGYSLQVVYDEGLTFDNNSKYISVGNTTLKDQAGVLESTKTLKVNGFAIKTVGESIFIVGGTENGVVYGAYEFLHQILNFEQYFTDTYSLNTMVRDIPLMNYNIKELPDIQRMIANVGALMANSAEARRMRMYYTPVNLYIWDGGDFTNTSFKIIPPSKYMTERREWFSDDQSQLCYTAHGDPESYQLMIETYAEHLKQIVIDNPGKYIYKLADQDVVTRCQCSACNVDYETYKCASGSKIIFSNKVMDILNDWFENDPVGQAHYNPDLVFRFNAYNLYEQAPVNYDVATDTYTPIDEKMILRPGLGVEIAPVFADFSSSYFDESNLSYYNNMRAWQALFDGQSHIGYWTYCFNDNHFMYFFNTFDTMQEHYQIYASFGAESVYDQSLGNNFDGLPSWYSLKTYLLSKIAWNTNLNLDELTKNFFDNYYGEAADVMYRFYSSQRAFNTYQEEVLGYGKGNYNIKFVANKREYWPKSILEGWRNICAEAIEKIQPLKTKNIDKYNKIYKHIVSERSSIDFILLELYGNQLSNKYNEYKTDFIAEVKLNNISYYGAGRTMTNFINSLN